LEITDMNILVTGASRGIGRALVHHFAGQQQHRIIALARNQSALIDLQEECRHLHGADVAMCVQDLASDAYESLQQSLNSLDRIDVLIANAGQLLNRPFLETSSADWHTMLQQNVVATANLLRQCYPKLAAAGKAHVVIIGSMGGLQGSKKFPGLSAYSAAKGALAILTECLAEEWKQVGISVNCLCLGAVNTEMLDEAFPGYKAPVNAEDMARFIGDFSQSAHHFMNGRILPVALSDPD
jgi:3-oxoacyl-[acyl-carrier protein] reductase